MCCWLAFLIRWQVVKFCSVQPTRGNTRLFFLAGDRALKYFQSVAAYERSMIKALSTGKVAAAEKCRVCALMRSQRKKRIGNPRRIGVENAD